MPVEADNRASGWIQWLKTMATASERDELLGLTIDFEGTATVNARNRKDLIAGVSYEPLLVVCQAARRRALLDVVTELADGNGTITGPKDPGDPKLDFMFSWRFSGAKTRDVASRLVPYLFTKRRQAEIVVEYPHWDGSPRPMPSWMAEQRSALYKEVHELNRKYNYEIDYLGQERDDNEEE